MYAYIKVIKLPEVYTTVFCLGIRGSEVFTAFKLPQ